MVHKTTNGVQENVREERSPLGSRGICTLTSQSPVVCPVDACVSFSKFEVSRTTTSEQKDVPAIKSKRSRWQ
jgi:hypothetical protein